MVRRAFMERNAFWNRVFRRNYTDSPLWRQGMELHRLADLSSIAPLESVTHTIPTSRYSTRRGSDIGRTTGTCTIGNGKTF